MPSDEPLLRQRKNNRLMAAGLAGVALLVLLGMVMAVALETSFHRTSAQSPPSALAGAAP